MSGRRITRRRFLQTSAAAMVVAPVAAPRLLRAGAADRLKIAVIGTQGQGRWNIGQISGEHIVALCDVDADRLARSGEEFPDAARYRDFRIMLEKQPDIEAVLIAAPDHIHAPAAAMAMRLGKHVYCEKPLAHSVHEVRQLANLAAEHGVATQMGTQIHAGSNYRRVVELIRSGAIGPVREAYVWCGKSWSDGRFQASSPPPAALDWDLWLGPAPARPYCDGLHPREWRRFWDYGNGTLGDMGCHYLDLVHWALDLRHPMTVKALGPHVHDAGTPASLIVQYEYAARGEMPPVKVVWSDGGERPSILSALKGSGGLPLPWGDGQLFVGDEGMLISDYDRYLLLPQEKYADFTAPEPFIADSIGHHQEWIQACMTGSTTTCNFDYAGALTEAVLLGTVAFRLGRKIEWDPESLTAVDDPDANRFLRREYREGWSL